MFDHKIVVAPDGDGWRVSIVPALPLGYEPELVPDSELAMARARLWRLRHGFSIVAPLDAAKKGKR